MDDHLTVAMQKLIIYSLNNGGIKFKSQDVYKSIKYYNAIGFLKRNNIIKQVCTICGVNILNKITEFSVGICDNKDKNHKHFNKEKKLEKHFTLTLRGELLGRYLRSIK